MICTPVYPDMQLNSKVQDVFSFKKESNTNKYHNSMHNCYEELQYIFFLIRITCIKEKLTQKSAQKQQLIVEEQEHNMALGLHLDKPNNFDRYIYILSEKYRHLLSFISIVIPFYNQYFFLLQKIMALCPKQTWIEALGLTKDAQKYDDSSPNKQIAIVCSSIDQKQYKIVKYRLPNSNLLTNNRILKNKIQKSKVQNIYFTLDLESYEFIVVQRVENHEKPLEIYIEKHQRQTLEFWKDISLKIVSKVCHRMLSGIIQRNLSLQSISICRGEIQIEPPLFRWIIRHQNLFSNYTNKNDCYCAPEVREKYNHTAQSDIYSLGIVLAQLLSKPYVKKNDKISNNSQQISCLIQMIPDKNIQNLVYGMIQQDPNRRPSISDIICCLNGQKLEKVYLGKAIRQSMRFISIDIFRQKNESFSTHKYLTQLSQKVEIKGDNFFLQIFQTNDPNTLMMILQCTYFNDIINFSFILQHQRLFAYLQQNKISVEFSDEGIFYFEIKPEYPQIWKIQQCQQTINCFLSVQQQKEAELFSSAFRKVKYNMGKCLKRYKIQPQQKIKKTEEFPLKHKDWRQIGDELFGNNRLQLAIHLYQRIIEQYRNEYPQIDGLPSFTEIDSFLNDNYHEWYIVNTIEGAVKVSPYTALCLCYYKNEKVQEGICWLKKMLNIYPRDFRLTFCLGNLELYRFNTAEAIRYFKQTIQLNSEFTKSYILISWLYFKSEDPYMRLLSRRWLEKTNKIYREEDHMLLGVMVAASTPSRQEKIDKFKLLIDKYQENRFVMEQYVWCCFSSKEQAIEGIKIIEEQIQKYPQVWSFYHSLGLLMEKSEAYTDDDIEKVYLRAITLNPTRNFRSHNNLSFLKSKTKQAKFQHCNAVIQINPYSQAAYRNLYTIFKQQNKIGQALQCLRIIERINPEYSLVYYFLGNYYHELENKQNKSIEYLKRFINMVEPQDAYLAILQLGQVYQQCSEFYSALQYYQLAKSLKSNDYKSWFYLGDLYVKMGRHKEAQQNFLKTYQLNSSPIIKTAIHSFYLLSGQPQKARMWNETSP